jgi:flagellar basal body-associated protein FliL
MKQKDIVLILVMVFISAVVSFLVSGWVFNSPQNRKQTAEKVDQITPEFPEPPPKYFNAHAINPTQLITIGDATNPNPFNNKAQ